MATFEGEWVNLPVGFQLEEGGERCTRVRIEKMKGVDQENLTDKSLRNNGAKAVSRILQRCVQEIEGALPAKQNPDALADLGIFRRMTVIDRDTIFLGIVLRGRDGTFNDKAACPECGLTVDVLVDVRELPVYEWVDDLPVIIGPIDLEDGLLIDGETYTRVWWRTLTGKDQEDILKQPQRSQVTTQLALGICDAAVERGGEWHRLGHAPDSQVIRRMTLDDQELLTEAVEFSSPGVDLRVTADCDDCGEFEHSMSVDRFFRLAREKRTPRGSARGRKRSLSLKKR